MKFEIKSTRNELNIHEVSDVGITVSLLLE